MIHADCASAVCWYRKLYAGINGESLAERGRSAALYNRLGYTLLLLDVVSDDCCFQVTGYLRHAQRGAPC